MTIQEATQALADLQIKRHAYDHAMGVIYYDAVTAAPQGSAKGRGETLGFLNGVAYELFANDTTRALLDFLTEHPDELTAQQNREVEMLRRELDEMSKVPMDEYVAFQVLCNEADSVWHKAKTNNDYASFCPLLQKIVDTLIRFAAYDDPTKPAYDVWLNRFERGLTMEKLDVFFAELRETIVPLLKRIQTEAQQIDTSFLDRIFPAEKQRIFSDKVMEVMNIDRNYCSIGETEHPFTTQFNNKDVRITTHYHEDALISSLFSVIHEGGHALYELGVDDKYMNTCLGLGVSMGIHESQSRLFENMIGRSAAFVSLIFPTLKELFPEQLKDVEEHQFYLAVNKCEASLIRTEADELTYCLHIMVRYEIEKLLMSGSLKAEGVPAKWNELMQEYLGIVPPNDTQGALQDSHWSGGMIGYFPSYAIGSAYAAQIMACMKKEMDVDELIRKGELSQVTAWLREKIHCHGCMYDPDVLFSNCCGEEFNPRYYTAYLKEKYSTIYNLK